MPHTRDHVYFDMPGEPRPMGPLTPGSTPLDRTPFAFRPAAFVPPTPTAGGPTPHTGSATVPFTPIPVGGPVHYQPFTVPGFIPPGGPSAPGGFPFPGGPGAPPGAGGFTFTPTPGQGTAACNLLPPGAARDACLVAATFLPGGQTPTFTPTGATPGGIINPPLIGGPVTVPEVVSRQVHECPRYVNGKGILWMDIGGNVVCLPRGHNGRDFGLIRKNPKRKKPYISAAQIKQLKSVDRTKKKAKAFAKLAGLHTHAGHRRGR